jgi:ABC-type phosphate transport system auxiliary subunit
MMPAGYLNSLLSANRELRNFLERVDALIHGTSDLGADQLRALGHILEAMAPEISEAKRAASLDASLQAEIREYTANLQALQASIEQVRCVLLARRAQIEAAQQHLGGLQGWTSAYRRTA